MYSKAGQIVPISVNLLGNFTGPPFLINIQIDRNPFHEWENRALEFLKRNRGEI